MLSPGDVAPSFVLPSDSGEMVDLASLRGRWVVLYFYPRDDTMLCTAQSCAFRDAFPRFTELDAVILGISADSVASHAKFRRKFNLPFALLADEGAAVSTLYGVWKLKSLFGHKFMGIERTTFVIAPDGRIARIFPRVKVRRHAEAVLEALTALR
jgi:peroxiredoxin Q/BCP